MRSKGSGHLRIEPKEIFDLLLEHLTKRLLSILAVLHKQGGVGCFNGNIEVNQWDDNSCSVQHDLSPKLWTHPKSAMIRWLKRLPSHSKPIKSEINGLRHIQIALQGACPSSNGVGCPPPQPIFWGLTILLQRHSMD